MVEKEVGPSGAYVVESWHGFHPLSEIVNGHHGVVIPTTRCRSSFLEIIPPFVEGTSYGDMMERSWWRLILEANISQFTHHLI